MIFTVDAPPVTTAGAGVAVSDEEGEEALAPLGDGRVSFTARVDARSKARPRHPIRLTVDPSSLHFFDPESGAVLGRGDRAASVPR